MQDFVEQKPIPLSLLLEVTLNSLSNDSVAAIVFKFLRLLYQVRESVFDCFKRFRIFHHNTSILGTGLPRRPSLMTYRFRRARVTPT